MAAPASVTLKSLNGDFVMNKTLSGDFDSLMALQGISWLKRKGIGMATITLHIKEYDDDQGVTHIDIDQTVTGGLQGTSEKRTLNDEAGEHEDHVFGKVRGRSKWIKLSDVEEDFLKEGWLPEMNEGNVVRSYVESVNNGWTADQIWGFKEIKGERRYCRNAMVKKGDTVKTAELVYDYVSK